MKRPTLNFTYSVWLAVIFSVGKAISEFKTITESWKTKDEMKIMGVNSWYCGRRGVPKISVPGSRERVATGHSKTICCLFPSFITGRMAWWSAVPRRERRGMFKQSFALESTSHAAQWSHTFSCFLLLDLFVWKKKNVRAFEIGERFNPQKTHTQTHGQGSGRRSNGSELSLFGPRTSEVPLCAALHLFYPSSLIRPGWPCDPGARVTCQLTVYSWALGLMLCQHLLCKGEERNLVQCGGKKTKATKKKQKLEKVRKTAFILFWNQLVKIYVAFVSTHPDSLHVKRMCDNSCWLRGAQQTDACMDTWWGVPTKTLQKPPHPLRVCVCCQLSIRLP